LLPSTSSGNNLKKDASRNFGIIRAKKNPFQMNETD
jgi:hypothetical protein